MASEMECAGIFIVAAIRGVKAGAIMAYGEMNEHTMEVTIDAIKTLIAQDRAKQNR